MTYIDFGLPMVFLALGQIVKVPLRDLGKLKPIYDDSPLLWWVKSMVKVN